DEHERHVEADDLPPRPPGRRPEVEVVAVQVAREENAPEPEAPAITGERGTVEARRRDRIADLSGDVDPGAAQRDLPTARNQVSHARAEVCAPQPIEHAAASHRASGKVLQSDRR